MKCWARPGGRINRSKRLRLRRSHWAALRSRAASPAPGHCMACCSCWPQSWMVPQSPGRGRTGVKYGKRCSTHCCSPNACGPYLLGNGDGSAYDRGYVETVGWARCHDCHWTDAYCAEAKVEGHDRMDRMPESAMNRQTETDYALPEADYGSDASNTRAQRTHPSTHARTPLPPSTPAPTPSDA